MFVRRRSESRENSGFPDKDYSVLVLSVLDLDLFVKNCLTEKSDIAKI